MSGLDKIGILLMEIMEVYLKQMILFYIVDLK